MKIGLDISQIVYTGTGVARFTNGLVNSILEHDKKNQWLFFFSGLRQQLDKRLETNIRDADHELVKWKVPPSLLSFLWNDLHQFSTYNSQFASCDFFVTSDWTEPNLSINKAAIVHDLTYLRYPETVHTNIRRTQSARLKWIKEESKIIFADSEITKRDLTELLQIDSNKIVVNYPGVGVVIPTETEKKATLTKYNLTKPFILSVGKLEPRKNLPRLIEAFQKLNNDNMDLILVGPKGWNTNIEYRTSNIKYLGQIPDSDLYSLYSTALFFVYPSIWEGFGYPIIEAMKLGTPVTCSNTSSIMEIADDAALLFDPDNVEEITHCINTMSQDDSLRKKLIAKGMKRSKIFAWQNYYNKLIQILYENRS